MRVDLSVEIAGIPFSNPVIAASGTFGYGEEFASLFDLNLLGGLVVKGLSASPMAGNPAPRMTETAAGLLNSIGLQNIGARAFVQEKLPFLRTLKTNTIANVFGRTHQEYLDCIAILNEAEGLAAYELNISCPNTDRGGMIFGNDPQLTYDVVRVCKKAARVPLWVKLSPNVTDITEIARAATNAGADALCCANTFVGMAVEVETRRPKIPTITAGLSGPAIKPLALRMVYQTAQAVNVPVIGIGGIVTAEDALEFLIAGARAVGVGTANFFDPTACVKIVRGLEDYCRRKKIEKLSALVGSLRVHD